MFDVVGAWLSLPELRRPRRVEREEVTVALGYVLQGNLAPEEVFVDVGVHTRDVIT